MEESPHISWAELEPLLRGFQEPDDVGMRHHHALRQARRSGSIDDIGGVLRPHATGDW